MIEDFYDRLLFSYVDVEVVVFFLGQAIFPTFKVLPPF